MWLMIWSTCKCLGIISSYGGYGCSLFESGCVSCGCLSRVGVVMCVASLGVEYGVKSMDS